MNTSLNRSSIDIGGHYDEHERMRWLGHYLLLRAVHEHPHDERPPTEAPSRARQRTSVRAKLLESVAR